MGNKVRPAPAQVFTVRGHHFSTRSFKPQVRAVARKLARRAAAKQ